MEYLVKDEPSILKDNVTGKAFPFKAEEEVFAVINPKTNQMVSLDFEKRNLSARCIIRYMDYERKSVSEIRAVSPKFRIKSTFSPLPYSDSDIIFLGGGFTASAVSRDGKIGLIFSAPDLVLPDGRKGLKGEVHMENNSTSRSFNCRVSLNGKSESLHASHTENITGSLWLGEDKFTMGTMALNGRHIWKRSNITKRREKPIAVMYGEKDNAPYSIIALTYDDSLTFLTEKESKFYSDIKWKEDGEEKVKITNGKDVEIEATVFQAIHEANGPFRRSRTFRYALFNGRVGELEVVGARGYLEYPDHPF